MHITAYCPECHSRYQLKADLIGRKMRCKTSSCQAIFVIEPASGGVPTNGEDGPRAANARGELVVPLTAAGQAPIEEFDWRSAPPPVQQGTVPVAKPAGPPVRPTVPVAKPAGPPPTLPPQVTQWEEPASPRRRGRWALVGLLVIVLGTAGYGVAFLIKAFAQDEAARRAAAEKAYANGSFQDAAKKYHELADGYRRSEHAGEYQLLADLSDLRDAASPPVGDPAAALGRAEAFVKKYEARDPKVKPYRNDVSRALVAVAESFALAAVTAAPTEEGPTSVPELTRQGREVIELLRSYPPKDSDQVAALQDRFDKAGEALTRAEEKRRSIAQVRGRLTGHRPDITGARRLAEQLQVGDDPAVKQAIAQAEEQSLSGIAYRVMNQPPQRNVPTQDPPVLLLETVSASGRPSGPPADVVLAVARGILYALDGRDGHRLWACRVGLDSGELPARIPSTGDGPDLVLVAAADPPGLTARNARTGAVVWHQSLEAPCLGRPVLSAGRLYVPTTGPTGFIYDFDARGGVNRGRFDVGRPLAAGGAFDVVTQRLYVPAHGQGVFVFNYGESLPAGVVSISNPPVAYAPGLPRFEGLLPTGHPAGSLRGEPIVVTGEQEGPEVSRYLVLGQADGLDAMTLRAFRLLAAPTRSPVTAEARLPGWSWFPPYHDPETIALVTDAGAIGLFGIQQRGDFDPPIFPLVAEGSPEVRNANSSIPHHRPARAQMVHASESGFWVLADGVLRHWRLGLTRQFGRQLTPAVGDGRRLGSPVHTAQVSTDRRTLFVVTQTDSPPAYRATAVDAATGDIIWQRPLGLAPQGNPLELGGAVVVLDQSGALYRFAKDEGRGMRDETSNPSSVNPLPSSFSPGGREIAKSEPSMVGRAWLLPAADGKSAWSMFVIPDQAAYKLVLRRVAADGTITSTAVNVPAPPAGAPALGPNAAVLPLADGQLFRVSLDIDNPKPALGPTWRAAGARPDARGLVARWKGDEFLVGDGGRRLLRLSWPAGTDFSLDKQHPVDFSSRLFRVAAATGSGASVEGAVVADASGTVALLRGDRTTVVRSWRLGPITAGPWVVGNRLAVVSDHKTFVCLNPEVDAPVWKYMTRGDGIESPPRLIDGKLVIVDSSGRFLALDPATGKPTGNGYEFPAEAAPASAVVPFGPGRLFAPLTDGTVLVAPLTELSK